MRSPLLLAGAALLALSACAPREVLTGRPDMRIVDGSTLPPPDRADLIQDQRPYVVGPFDRVSIDIYGLPEVSRTVQVDASGQISLPLVGTVEASGKTPVELAQMIDARLRGKYVRDPQVNINVDTVNQMITLDGQVQEPGQYPVTGRITLMRAVARAKGLTEYAKSEFVVVYRKVGGQEMAALYDLRGIRQGLYPDPEIYANDVIYVGESGRSRVFQSIIQSAPLLTAPIIALLN
jgi:polysaccharide biosynthesis/export protein